MPRLYTIGYEQASLDQVIGALKAAGVAVVVDVRAVAASRRPGFSKTMLGASLKAEGVDYVHLRALGTPKAGREAARAGRTAQMRAIFEAHLGGAGGRAGPGRGRADRAKPPGGPALLRGG